MHSLYINLYEPRWLSTRTVYLKTRAGLPYITDAPYHHSAAFEAERKESAERKAERKG